VSKQRSSLTLRTAIDAFSKINAAFQHTVQQDEAKSAIASEKVKQQEAKTAKEVANAKTAEAKSRRSSC
jgi:hypothetical protein